MAETQPLIARSVSVAPIVLLSVLDHYQRMVEGTQKRAVGALLGHKDGMNVRVTNSFAAPFDEDDWDPAIWFLEHSFIGSMSKLFKKMDAKEKIIGWYHSGPKLRGSDIKISEIFEGYTPNPLLVIVDVKSEEAGALTKAYVVGKEVKEHGTDIPRTFIDIPSFIETNEAEEVGIENLLRDIGDVEDATLTTCTAKQSQSLQLLRQRLRGIIVYLQKVIDGKLLVNHNILIALQEVFNLLPNSVAPSSGFNGSIVSGDGSGISTKGASELSRAIDIKANDKLMIIYLSSLVRAVTTFHDLVENRIQNKRQQDGREVCGGND